MQLRIFTEPQQGASHADLLAVAKSSRELGFDGFFRSDHLLTIGGPGLPGPSDAMISLAAIAAQVPDIRLGTLVNSATFRHPSMLAIGAANLDDISGGRLELGLGTGWYEAEHTAYGIPFGDSFGDRFSRLTEQLEILTGLWGTPVGSTFDYAGKYFRLAGAPGLPKPVQTKHDGTPHVPLIIGGSGTRRTPAVVARFADEYNRGFTDVDSTKASHDLGRAACEKIGRDPGTLTYSAVQVVCCGADDAEVARRAAAIGREVDVMKTNGLAGTPGQVVDKLAAFAEAGVDRIYLQVWDLADLEHLALIAEQVLPHLS